MAPSQSQAQLLLPKRGLITDGDGELFREVFSMLKELSALTGENVLLITPFLLEKKSSGKLMSPKEIADLFQSETVLDLHDGEVHDYSKEVKILIEHQTEQSYRFARLIGLEINNIPALVFFDNLKFTDHFACWKIQELSINRLVRDLRLLVADVDTIVASKDNRSILDAIASRDQERIFIKRMEKALDIVKQLKTVVQ